MHGLNPIWKKLLRLASGALLIMTFAHNAAADGPLATRSYQYLKQINPSPHSIGMASWYGTYFHGRKTANGEVYNMHELTAAHQQLPFGCRVRVINTLTRKGVVVRINDRGPFKDQRIIDLSLAAAKACGLIFDGVAPVILEIVDMPTPAVKPIIKKFK